MIVTADEDLIKPYPADHSNRTACVLCLAQLPVASRVQASIRQFAG